MNNIIEVHNIHKSYQLGDEVQTVLNGINLSVAEGELMSIMGQSGSGKSTFMNILGLLDRPDNGQYYFAGQEIASLSSDQLATIRNRSIGFVFQAFFLLPRMQAWQNVALPLLYQEIPEREQYERAMDMLDKLGMAKYANHKPKELSGGQQQRVAIARALVGKPILVLADEPTGSLDQRIGQEILDQFIDLNNEQNTTLIIITHDPAVAKLCHRQVKMHQGQIEVL